MIGIYDTDGNLKVKYIYDAWGNCTIDSQATTDMDLARANPIRYRGYYYDEDTGLYYLNSRYYSPELRRFISPDNTAYLDAESANGLNLYAYCGNDPVNRVDPTGHAWYNTVWDWVNTIAGLLNPFSTLTALGTLAYAALTGRWGDIVDDWKAGCLNPFNRDEKTAKLAKVLSFYKGSTVVVQNVVPNGGFSMFGTIWIGKSRLSEAGVLEHEYGHTVQERILGPAYLLNVVIPSAIYYQYDGGFGKDEDYYSTPWERIADWLGKVPRTFTYKRGSLAWGIVENLLGPIVIPFYFLFGY